ncbi:hypothetical protein L484_021685 [Morus notabilis]|uniref:Transmembrane protein n=1 Tax=Morus notabilis TaxID=981085 RepID=W9S6P9_9ROSA|nr:hypothetical protein L484_021685 [Morus notabilis]
MMKGRAETEAQDEANKGVHRDEEVKTQGPSSQAETTRARLRFEEELNKEALRLRRFQRGRQFRRVRTENVEGQSGLTVLSSMEDAEASRELRDTRIAILDSVEEDSEAFVVIVFASILYDRQSLGFCEDILKIRFYRIGQLFVMYYERQHNLFIFSFLSPGCFWWACGMEVDPDGTMLRLGNFVSSFVVGSYASFVAALLIFDCLTRGAMLSFNMISENNSSTNRANTLRTLVRGAGASRGGEDSKSTTQSCANRPEARCTCVCVGEPNDRAYHHFEQSSSVYRPTANKTRQQSCKMQGMLRGMLRGVSKGAH